VSWGVSEFLQLGTLLIAAAALGLPIARRVMNGAYATRDWVESKLRPVHDEQRILAGRIRDVDADYKVLRAELKHMPTIGHLDEIREQMNEIGKTNAVNHAENKTELQNVRRTLEEIREDLKRRDR